MKKRIVVEYGKISQISKDFKVTRQAVYKALNYLSNSSKATLIRKVAIERGGVEIGDQRMFLLLLGDEFKEYFSLTTKQKFYVWYFCLSFCFLCITDDSPIWAIIVVVLNFANAARLIKKVPISTDDKDI